MQETLTDVEKRLVEAEEVTSEPVEDPELQAGGSCVMGLLCDRCWSLAVYSSLRRDRNAYSRPGKNSSPTGILVFLSKTFCRTQEFFH